MKNNKYMMIAILFNLLFFITSILDANSKEYIVPNNGKVIATISEAITRIEVENDRISQVIGNEEEYIIDSDRELGQIFITPILKAGKDISLNIVTEQGKLIDIKFTINSDEPESILLKYNILTNSPINFKNSSLENLDSTKNIQMSNKAYMPDYYHDFRQDIIEALKQIRVKNKEVHNIQAPPACIKDHKEISYLNSYRYQNEQYSIIEINILSKNNELTYLHEQDFSKCFRGIQAVAIENNILDSNQTTKIYLVK